MKKIHSETRTPKRRKRTNKVARERSSLNYDRKQDRGGVVINNPIQAITELSSILSGMVRK